MPPRGHRWRKRCTTWCSEMVHRHATFCCGDYARGIVEVAIGEKLELNIDPSKVRPPYKSDWPLAILPEEELEKYGEWNRDMPKEESALSSIYFSVMGYGDFARYVIGCDAKKS